MDTAPISSPKPEVELDERPETAEELHEQIKTSVKAWHENAKVPSFGAFLRFAGSVIVQSVREARQEQRGR